MPRIHAHLPTSHPLAVISSLTAELPEDLDDLQPQQAARSRSMRHSHAGTHVAGGSAAHAEASDEAGTWWTAGEARRLAREVLTAGCGLFVADVRLASALMETASEQQPVRKLAKPLLKQNPLALPLWLAYAQAEAAATPRRSTSTARRSRCARRRRALRRPSSSCQLLWRRPN